MRVVAIVLAAGASTRFGTDKLKALLDGRPVLDHVLDRLRAVPSLELVVVSSPDRIAAQAGAGETWVVNPAPERGISSSLRIGLEAARALPGPRVEAVLIALGDQPRIEPSACRALIETAATSSRPILAPAYEGGGGHNPVLIRADAFAIVDATEGDRGLVMVLESRPDLVELVLTPGVNPDVDRPADLDALRA